MVILIKRLFLFFIVFTLSYYCNLGAQSIYELRKLSEQDWLSMSTEERLKALNIANRHTQNQTFVGDFGRYYDLYKKWGYDYYEMNDEYENYAFRGFENYNVIEQNRRIWGYNDFGDRITKMTHIGNIWHETYESDGTFYVEMPNGYINSIATKDVDGVWLAKERTDDWAISVIGSPMIRTKFTPLTLSIPNVHGMRMDYQTANTDVAIVNSSLLGSWWYNYQGTDAKYTQMVEKGGVLLRGGYVRRKFGILTLGASYVNQYGVQGNREGGDSWYGTVSNYTPTPLIVAIRFLDDSPADNEGGPIIYDVKLKVDGRYRPDIVPDIMLDDVTRDRTTAITKVTEQDYLYPPASVKIGKPEYDYLGIEGSLPKYADYFYIKDFIKGTNLKNVVDNFDTNLARKYYQPIDPGGKPLQVNGSETAVYFFDISTIRAHVNRVEAEITVANDYNIQTAMIYTKDTGGGHDTAGKNKSFYDATYWKTMAQAEGNIKDKSNTTRLTIDFGLQVASIIYGVDMDLDYRGLKITGEFVTNSSHYMYPDGQTGTGLPSEVVSEQAPRTGHRWAELDHAYYVTVQKDWNKFGVAGELFKMGKFYRPYIDYYYALASEMGYGVNAINSRNNMIRFPLIEDNDDDDMYPDVMIEQRTMGYRILSSDDPDGVFPGNDNDHDGIPDTDKNRNDVPDYDEPFLMFDIDPDEFVIGNDFNNNTIPDFRENDMKLDTPYDLDRKGYHYMLRYTPVKFINFITGSFKTHGVGKDNRTDDKYIKLLLDYSLSNIGKIHAEYRYERIQDDIPDRYFIKVPVKQVMSWGTDAPDRGLRLYNDMLEYKNSQVNRLYIDSVIRAHPAITMENHVKLERNRQLKGIMYDYTYQPGEIINASAMSHKVVYTRKLGNWMFSPGFKYRLYKKDHSETVY
ncbi:MAG: hypothetical protein JXB48_14615, partial [Candidatus Latescibacteria bacterium]|nr:hypothetical protein [Candidatus Latescibacterota bacterium]